MNRSSGTSPSLGDHLGRRLEVLRHRFPPLPLLFEDPQRFVSGNASVILRERLFERRLHVFDDRPGYRRKQRNPEPDHQRQHRLDERRRSSSRCSPNVIFVLSNKLSSIASGTNSPNLCERRSHRFAADCVDPLLIRS